jgi:23S rRNA (uracil1939-C5)-methyltransferase
MLAPGAVLEVTVERLGSQGDGVGRIEGQTVRVPLTLPGERWQVRLLARCRGGWDAEALAALHRVGREEPFCRHFPACGGCRLQHLPARAYADHKRRRIVDALARRGIGAAVLAPRLSPLGSRRRLRLAWSGKGGRLALGLRQRRSRAIVALEVCPVARPSLVAEIAPLRDLLAGTPPLGREGEVLLVDTEAGVDVGLLPASTVRADAALLGDLAAYAAEHDLARLCLGRAPVVTRQPPTLVMSGAAIPLPPGAFVQATAEGERALVERVQAATDKGARVVDLFAGLGGLGLATLAAGARTVHAVESDADALAALLSAGRPGVAGERRDLRRRPLGGPELARFDLALLDPPRAGAVEQVRELARAGPPRIVYAACDPESFARDAALLVGGGYGLGEVLPIDQFVGSAEVELVAALTRHAAPRRAGA